MITWLNPLEKPFFPDPNQHALPDGLLAAGGLLQADWLITAYSNGIFPWFNPGEPILWWSPDPRAVLLPENFALHKRFKRFIRNSDWLVRWNTAFESTVRACAEPRSDSPGTWISEEMLEAYVQFHQLGLAQSVEIWEEGKLVGGVYGPVIGGVFFGESMFSKRSNASKSALFALCHTLVEINCQLIDCQIMNPHLEKLGATTMSRQHFVSHIKPGQTQQKLHQGEQALSRYLVSNP